MAAAAADVVHAEVLAFAAYRAVVRLGHVVDVDEIPARPSILEPDVALERLLDDGRDEEPRILHRVVHQEL